jgi:DNA-binding response OmpR family regulator
VSFFRERSATTGRGFLAMPTCRILTIEDDAAIRRGIVDALTYAGYDVLEAADGNIGCRDAVAREFDLLLLDMVLPGKSGLDILREVRNARPTLPVIILSARGEERDRVSGLRMGADDYVVKPFSVDELLARIDAVLRRSPARPSDVNEFAFDGGVIDFDRCEVRFDDGSREELSSKERVLLRYFVCHANRAISREELLNNVWQIDARGVTTRTIDMHVARLREKLHSTVGEPQVLRTVRGKGYMLAVKPQTAGVGES